MTDSNTTRLRRSRRIVFPAIALLVSALALEVFLQVVALILPQAAAVLDRHAGLLLPDPVLIHRPNPAYPEHDEWGFRNAAVPEHAFAVALGDSQTYGAMVPRDDAWPQQLAQSTESPVYNMAFGGYGAGEASVLLNQALQLQPQWVLFGLYAGNDLFDAYELAYKTSTLQAIRSDDPEVIAAIDAAESNGAIESAFRETHSIRASLKQWFGDHCKLYGLARAIRNTSRGSAWQEDDADWDTIVEQKESHPEWVLFEYDANPTTMTPRYRLLALDRNDPRIREGERITLAQIQDIAEQCTVAGAQFVLVPLPTKELAYQHRVEMSGNAIDPVLQQLWRNESAFWEACETVCTKNEIPVIDTLSPLRHSIEQGERPFRRDSDGHLTSLGNRIVSDAIQDYVAPRTDDASTR